MIVFPRGEVKTWSDLTPGALFGVSIRGETHLGVKIQGSGNKFHCAVLTGLPPHYVHENVVQNSLLYFFPSACAFVSREHRPTTSTKPPSEDEGFAA